MLQKIEYISSLRNQLSFLWSLRLDRIEKYSKLNLPGGKCDLCGIKSFHSCGTLNKDFKKGYEREREWKTRSAELDNASGLVSSKRILDIFPDQELPTTLFKGIMFKEIPIVNIRVSPNNTIINLTDCKGLTKLIWSCGKEGFKNTRKGTNLAAQATALTFSRKAVDMGYKTVRVRIQGLGPGRLSTVKGLTVGGLEIVSVTDNTPVSDNPPRGKKLRRI